MKHFHHPGLDRDQQGAGSAGNYPVRHQANHVRVPDRIKFRGKYDDAGSKRSGFWLSLNLAMKARERETKRYLERLFGVVGAILSPLHQC
jgi:hypothetical protein